MLYLDIPRIFSELDDLMEWFHVHRCVIDALPEIHTTRAFAGRFPGRVWLNYFDEHQKGSYRWDEKDRIVRENRTEALDASRASHRVRRRRGSKCSTSAKVAQVESLN